MLHGKTKQNTKLLKKTLLTMSILDESSKVVKEKSLDN